MTARLWHLFRTELRSHRWVLIAWVAAQLLVTAAVMTILYIWHHFDERMAAVSEFLQTIEQWSFSIPYSIDPWLEMSAGLLAAWIALVDPLQSPTAFWPTRPARLGEIVLAKALVCVAVFCVLPTCCGLLAGWMGGYSMRDVMLSGVTFLVVKAGLVPVGFLVGVLMPAPGRRLAALLMALGVWLGSMSWSWIMRDQPDHRDNSLTYFVIWFLTLAALPLLLRWRRSLGAQVALALLALSLPWITGPLKGRLTKVPLRSTESLGIASLSATPKARSYYLSNKRENGAPKETVVELNLDVRGMPPGVAAKAVSAQFDIESQTGGEAFHREWNGYALVMPTYYAALAHVLGTTPDKFPPEWRHQDYAVEFAMPQKVFAEWKDDEARKISGKVRLRLYRLEKHWEGVDVADGQMEFKDALRVHGAYVALQTSPEYLSVTAIRPQIADAIAYSDFSPAGSLFNNALSAWTIVFQPPVKGADGKFSRELRRTPALWADCKRNNENSNAMLWRTNFSSGLLLGNHPPEIREVSKPDGGMKGLPIAAVSRTAYAEVEVPLTPALLTKRQILETRKITPAKQP